MFEKLLARAMARGFDYTDSVSWLMLADLLEENGLEGEADLARKASRVPGAHPDSAFAPWATTPFAHGVRSITSCRNTREAIVQSSYSRLVQDRPDPTAGRPYHEGEYHALVVLGRRWAREMLARL